MFFGDARLIAPLEITVHRGPHIVLANAALPVVRDVRFKRTLIYYLEKGRRS